MIGSTLAFLLIDDLLRFRHLLLGLVVRNLKAVYTGSVGGALWVYLKPLIVILAYYFVFDQVLSVRLNLDMGGSESYALYLLSGLLPWLVFSDSVVEGASCLVREAELIKKTRFPIVIIPARTVLTSAIKIFPLLLIIWAVSMVVAAGSAYVLPVLVVWVGLQTLLSYYIVVLLAILSAALRDVGLLVESLFPMLLFFSPVLYPMENVPPGFQWVLSLNPYTPLAEGYHAILLRGAIPALSDITLVLGWLLLSLFIGRVLIRRSRETLVDWL
jgi:ABC-type polysaccharide/polyol phosphate export permease